MSVTARPLTVDGGLVTGIALGLRDVTEELRAKRELARSEEQFRMALVGAPEGMAVTDAHDRIVQANPALCELLATDVDQLIGHRFREFMPLEERNQVEDLREQLQLGELETVRLEHRLISAGGEVWVDHSVGVLRDEGGRPQLFVHQFADRTETRRMQADLTFRATHDVQTGLANRASLLTRLEGRLGVTPSEPDKVGVLWCDIDNLKQINDELGHRIGDVVIAAVADRLKESVRHQDLVGRIGGDEFVIVLEQCPNDETLMTVAQNVQQAASGPVETDIGKVKVTVSVGAVLAASTADTDEALSRADHALYRAKRAGRNQVAGEEPPEGEPLGPSLLSDA
jgi:diguanylate cyclase (GGDEF)-like protein/PAS domain S-box-containing protein